jgi:hypothetical protein
MTLVELQEKLGRQVELLTDENTPYSAKKTIADVAQTVSSLAKQMINNADVILRTEKLVADGKMQQSSIVRMIDNSEDEVDG